LLEGPPELSGSRGERDEQRIDPSGCSKCIPLSLDLSQGIEERPHAGVRLELGRRA
jgi:hypothetical protein